MQQTRNGITLALLLVGAFGAGIVAAPSVRPAHALATESRVFELRTYTTPPGQLPALHLRFREHTMELFARHGMTNVVYWTPADSARREHARLSAGLPEPPGGA